MTLEEIKVLLDQGKTEEVLKETEALSSAEAYGLRAWAHYRRKEFEKARLYKLAKTKPQFVVWPLLLLITIRMALKCGNILKSCQKVRPVTILLLFMQESQAIILPGKKFSRGHSGG